MTAAETLAGARASAIRRMMLYFAIVYIAEGLAQTTGIIKQPLTKFLFQDAGWNAAQVDWYIMLLGIPWWIKPLYGLVSDSMPLGGYRRKSYLLLFAVMAVLAYLGLYITDTPWPMFPCLLAIVIAMAATSALCGALVVDQAKHAHEDDRTWVQVVRSNVVTIVLAATAGWMVQYYVPIQWLSEASSIVLGGKMLGGLLIVSALISIGSAVYGRFVLHNAKQACLASRFCGQQSLWASIASVVAAFVGGWLSQHYAPLESLHTAALWALPAPLLVVLVTWPLVPEQKAAANAEHLRQGITAIKQALRSNELRAVAAFLALWSFNPGFAFGVMYHHMTVNLHFSQMFVGSLGGYTAIGMACGALIYMRIISHWFSVRTLALGLILCGATVQASFVFMADPQIAVALSLLNGALTAMAAVNAHVIAANRCPDHAEGFMYACLLSISNLSWSISGWIGGLLYVHVFHQDNFWLILLSAALTLCCAVLLRWLRVEREPA